MTTRGAVPAGISDRLRDLRALVRAESDLEARRRLAKERPPTARPFAVGAAARLRELRALCELARHLHMARR